MAAISSIPPQLPPAAPPRSAEDVPYPNLEDIVIDDGAPVDGMFSEKQMRLMTEALYSSWSPGAGHTFRALANVGLFHTYGEPPVVPDVMLAIDARFGDDLTKKENLSYFVWLRGKPPDVAIEIVSNREGGEADWKLELYARIRVLYYVIYDPLKLLSDQELRIFGLHDGRYQPIADGWLPAVGLGLKTWKGRFEDHEDTWLRWCDRDGKVLFAGIEKSRVERDRAAQAEQKAAQAEQKAQDEHRRAEELAQKLRALGVDPT